MGLGITVECLNVLTKAGAHLVGVRIAQLLKNMERLLPAGSSRVGAFGVLQGKAENFQRARLTSTVSDLALNFNGMTTALVGLLEAVHVDIDATEVAKTAGFTPAIAELSTDGQGILEAIGRLREASETAGGPPTGLQRYPLAVQVSGWPANCQGTLVAVDGFFKAP